jgi:hypothetical protein
MKSAPGVLIMFLVVESAYPKIVDSLLFSPDLQWRWRARCSFVEHLRPRLNGTPEHGNLALEGAYPKWKPMIYVTRQQQRSVTTTTTPNPAIFDAL